MPKPTATVRSLRPPAPRPVTKSSSKEQLNKKQPGLRTQSQPRPPNMELKTVSQPTTPKVYRKVVAVSSKIGSFTDHKPSGGNVQIFSETRTYKVQPKVGSLNNVTHTPGGGNVRIPTMKLDFKEKAKPKIDAKSEYVPPVPEKKVISQKLVWNAQSKVGSLDNVKHKPAGGNVQIFDERIQYVSSTNYKSNSSSMNNVNDRSRTTSRTHIDLLDL
ncbi:Microtubule-associated protein [Trichostrongylus colubriformis]|uniref:Microtubule-associated protein n=1 Tax=Trichostrongylus colubriformis TaxID=6319 RepID=A0AAN8EW40_TRICO